MLHKPFDLKVGDEIVLYGYKARIMKLNKSLPELVELQPLEPEIK